PGDGHDLFGELEQGLQVGFAVKGDPADTDAFGAGGEPEVLDREAGAVEVGVPDGVPTEDFVVNVAAVAADADADWRLADAFDLQVEELAGTRVEVVGLHEPLALSQRLHRRLGSFVADDDEAPGLHQPDRRGTVCGFKQTGYQLAG